MSKQLPFIASILSIFTHELNNHVSIMNESAGLTLDLIEIKGSQTSGDCGFDQISSVTSGITNQIKKTSELIKYLNRFAHRMDTPISNYNLNEVLEELFMLMARIANQKEITIDMDFEKEAIIILGNPSILQYCIFYIIQGCLKALTALDKIIVKTIKSSNEAQINIFCKAAQKSQTDSNLEYNAILKEIGGYIKYEADGLILILPLTQITNGQV